MTRLLASVRDVAEARLALAAGVDLIDCKDPSRGALEALDPALVGDIVAAVAGRAPVSSTLGDLPMAARDILGAIDRYGALGVDFLKLGLLPGAGTRALVEALATAARAHRLVAVLFADRQPDLSLLETLAGAGFAGAMLDTADKASGPLTRHLDRESLAEFVARCRNLGLMCGLAGSLRAQDLPGLAALAPDYLGFRGALCGGHRDSPLDAAATRRLRGLLAEHTTAA